MKKTYQNPTTTVVLIKLQQLMGASESMGFGSSVSTASGADARRRADFWDDEEE